MSAVLAARALASVPFVRTQIRRLRHDTPLVASEAFLVAAALAAVAATIADHRVVAGAVAVVLVARGAGDRASPPVPPVKVLGLRQMAVGFAVVAATAAGVLTLS